MSEYVDYRAFEPLIRIAQKEGIPEADLTAELGRSHDTLLHERGHVSWEEFARYCERIEQALGGPDAVEDIGLILQDVPAYAAVLRIGGLVASPKWFFHLLMRWFGPTMIPAVRHGEIEDIDASTLRFTLFSPEEHVDSPAFFRIVGSLFRYGPTLVGILPAFVTVDIAPRRATYTIQLPPSVSLAARARRALQSAWSGHKVIDELATQHRVLLENYEKLKRSEASFRMLIENSPDGVIVFTPDAIVYTNHTMSQFLGMKGPEELLRLPVGEICRDARALALWEETGRKSRRSEDVAFRRRDGEIVWAEVNTISVQYDGVAAYLSIVRDITLRHQVLARAVEMDRLISMGVLAAGVGHEIKNPLAYLKANIDYAKLTVQDAVDRLANEPLTSQEQAFWVDELEEVGHALEASIDGTDRLLSIAQDLNTFSRAADPKVELVMLEDVILTSINVARHEIRHRAKLVMDLECNAPVRANGTKLTQVLLNLLINAAQAIPVGQVDANEIRVRTRSNGRNARIEIEDTGGGIAPESLKHVFDPFFTTKPPGEGTGLGLSISRNIIESFGGELMLESTPGEGTTATVELALYDSGEDANVRGR